MLPAVSEMHQSQQLDLFPGYSVTQCLFKDVRNAAELRKSAVGGEIQGALINPSMIVVAANKAFHLQKVGKMKTRSLYSEVIFNLSPTNNISESFKKFGIADNDNTVLIVLIHSKEDEYYIDDIRSKIDGEQIPVELISTLSDVPKIKKLYKVTAQEDCVGTLLEAVLCRMAVKDVL
ncbi:EKC/KEOPS complex subunit TPRKB isoform X2 [Scleropages formosus]|uniref:EKC/KEOPS complex subunit TPRKB isoform X2 n=1 Tax=Scleropages formosus TaxID=113540 RepID=UPI0008784FE1|nr:EKC/KEOPS complex subunit TPRKB isoform X2 [Scleropages formosus]